MCIIIMTIMWQSSRMLKRSQKRWRTQATTISSEETIGRLSGSTNMLSSLLGPSPSSRKSQPCYIAILQLPVLSSERTTDLIFWRAPCFHLALFCGLYTLNSTPLRPSTSIPQTVSFVRCVHTSVWGGGLTNNPLCIRALMACKRDEYKPLP